MLHILGRLVFVAALALGGQAARAEVVQQNEAGFVTRAVAQVEADPREAWMALIAPAKWWNPAHTWSSDAANLRLTPQAGGCFCETIPESGADGAPPLAGSARHMVVVLAIPDRVLRMRGGLGPLQSEAADGVLTITLKPVDGGTQIVWEYAVGGYLRYDLPAIAKAVDGVMEEQLGGLAKLLGRIDTPEAEPEPDPSADPATQAGEGEAAAQRTTVDEAFDDLNR